MVFQLTKLSNLKQVAGFEDSTIVLWSLNGSENYGRKPYRSFDDRLCPWSINNCDRTLTDDLSDCESDEEVATNLMSDLSDDVEKLPGTSNSKQPRRNHQNKYKRNSSIRQQWMEYSAKSCSENSL